MPQHTFIAAVDIGASNIRVAIANADGEIEARRATPFPGGPPEQVLERIGRTIDDLARGVWVGARAAAIGVVVPGSVDPAAGTVSTAANLVGWGDVPIETLLGGPRGVPVAMENDANAAAIGERWLGAAKGLDDFVFIAIGTGIGAGVIIDGKLHRGSHFLAGEVAYFPMTPEELREPGWDHCLESDVGGRAMQAKAIELLGEHVRSASCSMRRPAATNERPPGSPGSRTNWRWRSRASRRCSTRRPSSSAAALRARRASV